MQVATTGYCHEVTESGFMKQVHIPGSLLLHILRKHCTARTELLCLHIILFIILFQEDTLLDS